MLKLIWKKRCVFYACSEVKKSIVKILVFHYEFDAHAVHHIHIELRSWRREAQNDNFSEVDIWINPCYFYFLCALILLLLLHNRNRLCVWVHWNFKSSNFKFICINREKCFSVKQRKLNITRCDKSGRKKRRLIQVLLFWNQKIQRERKRSALTLRSVSVCWCTWKEESKKNRIKWVYFWFWM